MLTVVSVSLGSSSRDKTTRSSFLGEEVELRRVGTDGDFARAKELIAELDGQVDAIGLGGIDLYLWAGNRRYAIRDARRLASAAQQTPVVDGSELKLLLERREVDQLAAEFPGPRLKGAKVLQVSAVDRYGLAEGLAVYAGQIVFGDLMYACKLPFPIRRLGVVRGLGKLLLPIITQLPFNILYPTGKEQEQQRPRFTEYFVWADWICGDFHYIRRNMPARLDGKVILTNTTTADDQTLLKQRGLTYLVTTTPVIDGRSFGMNVLEGCLVSLIRKDGNIPSREMLEIYLNKLDLRPNVLQLN